MVLLETVYSVAVNGLVGHCVQCSIERVLLETGCEQCSRELSYLTLTVYSVAGNGLVGNWLCTV